MIAALATSGTVLVFAMAVAWAVQRQTGNSGWIDTIWSFSVGLASLVGLSMLSVPTSRLWLLILLVAAWSMRLGMHIFVRTNRTKDDPRYAQLMAEWGEKAAPFRLFVFLQTQAIAGIILVLAILLAAMSPSTVKSPLSLLFTVLALFSVGGEALADAQLTAFKRKAVAGSLCDQGLWSVSRHPNYFFEWLFWVAIAGLAVSPPSGWISALALAAPFMMYGLLRYGSGVPHLEAHMRRTRPHAFAAYAGRVPEFFPTFRSLCPALSSEPK